MAWFDGTFDYTAEKLETEYPISVTPNLRQSKDGKRMAIINDFAEGSQPFCLSDPKAEEDDRGEHMFFHVFLGKDAAAAKQAVGHFIAEGYERESESVLLLRKESDRLFSYANGHICRGKAQDQEKLRSLFPAILPTAEEVFLLPLKRYMHKCPVCGYRTLLWRGYYMICVECGWEDEGLDDEDVESFGVNGDNTIRQYREKYFRRKAEDPFYTWSDRMNS